MKLTFLGTGTSQGVPMIACPCEVCQSTDPRDKRLRTSALIQVGGEGEGSGEGGGPLNFVIDAGPDFRAQMLAADVRRLDAILLTHEHKDHTGGIDDVRAYNYFGQAPIDIWATERVARAVRHDYAYAFEEHPYPGAPQVALNIFDNAQFVVRGVEITPIRGLHMNLPVTGFRFGGGSDGGGGLAYLTDFKAIDDDQSERLRGVDVLVVNAVGHRIHPSHFSLGEAIELGRRVGARQTYITHMAHRIGFFEVVEPTLPDGVHLAYDGLTITI